MFWHRNGCCGVSESATGLSDLKRQYLGGAKIELARLPDGKQSRTWPATRSCQQRRVVPLLHVDFLPKRCASVDFFSIRGDLGISPVRVPTHLLANQPCHFINPR